MLLRPIFEQILRDEASKRASIDELRIVSLKFNVDRFSNNVNSPQALDRLKIAFEFKGAGQGMAEVLSHKVNFNPT